MSFSHASPKYPLTAYHPRFSTWPGCLPGIILRMCSAPTPTPSPIRLKFLARYIFRDSSSPSQSRSQISSHSVCSSQPFFCFWAWFRFFTPAGDQLVLGWNVLLFPLVIVQIGIAGLGVALIFSALNAKYRDLAFLLSFITQSWMYATPVIYALSRIPENWRWLANLNPLTQPVEATKLLLLGTGTINPLDYAQSVIITLLLFAIGLSMFHRAERTFVDTV